MKKKQVRKMLINQTKRNKAILVFASLIAVFSLVSLTLLAIYNNNNKKQYIAYQDSSKINYQVSLKENNFFENDFLENDKQYISALVKNIDANFDYNIQIAAKEIEYKYKYRIVAEVEVKEKNTNNVLFSKEEILLEETENKSNDVKLNINKNISIDYNKYNDLIKRFIESYKLDNTDSNLHVKMYVDVAGNCESYSDSISKSTMMSVIIPLTTKTISIDTTDNLIDSANKVLKCQTTSENNKYLLMFAILFVSFAVIIIILMIRYIIKTRTAESIYEKELKKILNNYGTYIQMLGNDFYFKDYHMVKVDSFNDMLEIRDTIRQPILMRENQEKTGAYFIIPSSTKLLYIYRLKVSDIEKEIQKQLKQIMENDEK